MKKILFGLVLGISLTALVGAGLESYIANKKTAEVIKRNGMLVFTDSEPMTEYEKVGSVKIGLRMSSDYGTVRDALIKKALKEYPTADAILCYAENNGLSAVRADVIKFK